MPYASAGHIEARIPASGTREPAFALTLAAALNWADVQVNTGLSERYTVPFAAPYPACVVELAADFAEVKILRSNTESAAAQTAADKLEASCLATIERLVRVGIPELENATVEAPPADRFGYHSAHGCTSEIAAMNLWPY